MNKQDEIEKGLKQIFASLYILHIDGDAYAEKVLEYLASQGVVIKVAEISTDLAMTTAQSPSYFAPGIGSSCERTYRIFKDFKGAGYVLVEPLIKDKK